ncbi:hypothetical protein MCERE10_03631 [Burkholderiaceae bacterium]
MDTNTEQDPNSAVASAAPKNYKKIRAMNWAVAIFFIIGFAFMFLKSPSSMGSFLTLLFGFLFAGVPALTAIALTQDRVYFFSFSFFVSTKFRKVIRTAMFCANLIILLFGLVGIYLCVTSQQYLAIIGPLIFLVLAILNINALKKNIYI